MDMKLPEELIASLIEIGKTESFDALGDVISGNGQTRNGQFIRQRSAFWQEIGDALSDEDLAALIKTLTIAERDVQSCRAGSVSPVIWLFRQLAEKTGSDQLLLAEWILEKSENPYLPWGHHNQGANSLAEYRELATAVADRRADRQVLENARQEAASERIAQKASYSLYGAIRRRDVKAIHALLEKGGDPSKPCGDREDSPLDYAEELGNPAILEALGRTAPSEE